MVLDLRPPGGLDLEVLCLGAHADDLEIGCGGTVLRLLEERPGTRVHWVVLSGDEKRAAEARAGAGLFLGEAEHRIHLSEFRDGFFPSQHAQLKEYFEALAREVAPDLVFTHFRDDLHQDHRAVCELTWNTFRDHLVLEYEIPKYDGDLGRPNCYVPLSDDVVRRKIENLAQAFPSQTGKDWFDGETFRGLMRLRGMESRAASGYAEAFHARKLLLSP